MYSNFAFSGRRARWMSRLSILVVLALAACDTDQPLAPTTQPVAPNASLPAAAQPVVNPGKTGSMQFFMVAQNQAVVHVAGAEFKVTGPGANPATFTVKDNGPTDGDQTLGVVLLKGMTPGMYQVCMTVPPGNYGVAAPACRGAGVIAGTTTGHYWQIRTAATVFWKVVDFVPNYVGGTVFALKDSTNSLMAMFTDNASPDKDPGDGWLQITIPFDGTYSICSVTPPAGYVFAPANPGCTSFQVKQGTATIIANTIVTPIASLIWRVTDGTTDANNQPTLIGPSTFTVTGGPNSIVLTVVDNGPNDIDPALGKLAVIVSGLGWYSICETVPPIGHWNAKPSCKRVWVASGVPGQGDYFTNPEAQVINP